MNPALRSFAHSVFRLRQFANRSLTRFATHVHGRRILELGSGRRVAGDDVYSARRLFDASNEFIQSDVVEEYGHEIIDATTMQYRLEFDVVLCMSVLEHIYDHERAVLNIYEALKQGGTAVFLVPGMYPLHDEPYDYWRYTEHAVRRLLSRFRQVRIYRRGPRVYPFAYYIEAEK